MHGKGKVEGWFEPSECRVITVMSPSSADCSKVTVPLTVSPVPFDACILATALAACPEACPTSAAKMSERHDNAMARSLRAKM